MSIYNLLSKSVNLSFLIIQEIMHYFPRPWASEEEGGETGLTQWKMLEVDTFPSDSRLKCFKFAVFLILSIFWGLLAKLSMIYHPQ